MSEGVKIYYKAVVDNIMFLKRQQWTITNYALLLYAALGTLSAKAGQPEKVAFTALAIIGFLFALHCIRHTQTSMTRYYNNLFDLQQTYLTADERSTLKALSARPGFSHNGEFIYGLMAVNLYDNDSINRLSAYAVGCSGTVHAVKYLVSVSSPWRAT